MFFFRVVFFLLFCLMSCRLSQKNRISRAPCRQCFFSVLFFSPLFVSCHVDKVSISNPKIQNQTSKITRSIDKPSDSRHLVEGIKIPNPRSHDFANALWHHRNIDKTSDSRHLVVEGIKIPNPRSHDFANALWHHRNIDKTSDSRHLVVQGIKTPNPRSHDFAKAPWHHRNIDKTSNSRPSVVEGVKIPNPRSTKSKLQNPGFNIQNPNFKIQNPVFSGGEKARERKLKKESTWLRCQQPWGNPQEKDHLHGPANTSNSLERQLIHQNLQGPLRFAVRKLIQWN